MSPEKLSRIPELIEPWFIFSLVWSVGATGDSHSRVNFSNWLRIKMVKENVRGSTPRSGDRPIVGNFAGPHELCSLLVPTVDPALPSRGTGVRLQVGGHRDQQHQ